MLNSVLLITDHFEPTPSILWPSLQPFSLPSSSSPFTPNTPEQTGTNDQRRETFLGISKQPFTTTKKKTRKCSLLSTLQNARKASSHQEPFESAEEEIAQAYEELYGPAYSGESFLGNDVREKRPVKDEFEERVVQLKRMDKVVKGGKMLRFRAVVVVGDKKGRLGVGVAKAREIVDAIKKSAMDARKNFITVPMPHGSEANYGAAKVMIRPVSSGTGIIAGGAVLDMAGVQNASGKELGSRSPLNIAKATIIAVQKMRHFSEVAEERGIPMEEFWK
ncbi:unnamed protein product [Coffea canephora]|uniref:S5 DRBM domain-containing protein n=1 Tax=Coffea canephora TaxID=49390 RepID=A0A068TTD2_COFCA|nr:unnamed protein product [Coffea canephora]